MGVSSIASLSRNVIILCLVNFLVILGFGAFNIIRPYLVLALKGVLTELPEEVASIDAGEAVVEMGLMMSAFMATRSIMSIVGGWIGDVIERKKLIILGLSLYVVVGLLYGVVPSINMLILLRALQGVASGLVWPVAEALLADTVPSEFRARAISIYVMASNIARIIGPSIGVVAYTFAVHFLGFKDPLNAFRTPTVLISIFSLPALIASLTIKGDGGGRIRSGGGLSLRDYFKGFSQLAAKARRSLIVIFINGISNGIAMGIFMSIATVYAIEYIVKDPALLGGLMTIASIAGLISAYPASWLSDKIGRKPVVIASMIISRTSIILYPFTWDFTTLTLIYIARVAAFNISRPVMQALQADITPKTIMGRVFGLQQAFSNIGMFVGPIIGSYLYYEYRKTTFLNMPGLTLPFIISGLIGYITLILFALFVSEPDKKNEIH